MVAAYMIVTQLNPWLLLILVAAVAKGYHGVCMHMLDTVSKTKTKMQGDTAVAAIASW